MARTVRGNGEVGGQSESLFDEAGEAAASGGGAQGRRVAERRAGGAGGGRARAAAALAVRRRPRTLDEVIGQRHLTGAGTPFRKLIDNDAPRALLLWGPPGNGKKTVDHAVSQ